MIVVKNTANVVDQVPSPSRYAFFSKESETVVHATSSPTGWVKKNASDFGFSFSVPSDWVAGDLGPIGSTVSYTNPKDSHDTISFAYDYPRFAFTTQTMEERAHEQLYDVWPLYIAGEKGFLGVFTNQALWLAQEEIYIEHGGVTYDISLPSEPSDTVRTILSTFSFSR